MCVKIETKYGNIIDNYVPSKCECGMDSFCICMF